MRAVFPLRRLASAGLLFDFAGYYPAAVHARIQQRREQRAKSIDEAMRSDVAAIAGDMRRAMDKWRLG